MTYANATMLFDAMEPDRKSRVVRIFDLIRLETGFTDVREAFIAAVEDECKAIRAERVLYGTVVEDLI